MEWIKYRVETTEYRLTDGSLVRSEYQVEHMLDGEVIFKTKNKDVAFDIAYSLNNARSKRLTHVFGEGSSIKVDE